MEFVRLNLLNRFMQVVLLILLISYGIFRIWKNLNFLDLLKIMERGLQSGL
jgi:hypothetical protein